MHQLTFLLIKMDQIHTMDHTTSPYSYPLKQIPAQSTCMSIPMPAPDLPTQSQSQSQSPSSKPRNPGYSDLATLMYKDKGLSIFRSFRHLNAKNLLYYQAEIVNAEAELQEIIEDDATSGDTDREKFASSVRYLKDSQFPPSEQWKKFIELRGLLEAYNAAVLQYASILQLAAPHENDRELLRSWLQEWAFCKTGAEFDQWFGERDENADDLVTLSGRYENVDHFTKWVIQSVIPAFHEWVGWRGTNDRDIEMGIVTYDDKKIKRATRIASTITSSVIPASSMIALYLIKNMITRLIIIIIYNIAFSVILGFLAKARRVEVFAASTA
ncbi:hypothetical protein BDW60DRAFT_225026 [Aspergillus nidulans var. acristatus]